MGQQGDSFPLFFRFSVRGGMGRGAGIYVFRMGALRPLRRDSGDAQSCIENRFTLPAHF